MPAAHHEPSQKKSQGTGTASKHRDERIQALAQLLANKADATSVGYALAALYLESFDRALILRTELDELTCAQPEVRGLRREKELRRVRRALRLDRERMRLLHQAIAGILVCLGGTPRLLFEAVNKANTGPYEAEPSEARVNEMIGRVVHNMRKRAEAYGLLLPEFAQEAERELEGRTQTGQGSPCASPRCGLEQGGENN